MANYRHLLTSVQPPPAAVMQDVRKTVGVGELLHPPLRATQDLGGTQPRHPVGVLAPDQTPDRPCPERQVLDLGP